MAFNKNKIELNLSNYNDYLPINIIAYSFASSGAQGEAGGVNIISKEGKAFHFNYCEGDIKEKEIYLICPPLKEKYENNYLYEANWKDINMGMGNSLTVHISIDDKFKEKEKKLNLGFGGLFQAWKKIVYEILEESKWLNNYINYYVKKFIIILNEKKSYYSNKI